MKNLTFYLGFIFILIFFGCKKENNTPINQLSQNSFFDSSVQYLKSQLTSEDFAKLNLANKRVLRYKGKNIGVQIFEKNESLKKYLLLKNDDTSYSANWIDMSGLKGSENSFQNGTVTLESINNETQIDLEVKNNEIIEVVKTDKNLLQRQVTYYNPSDKNYDYYSREEEEAVELPDIIINWSGPGGDFMSLYWLFNQDSESEGMYIQGGTGGGGGGGTSAGGNDGVNSQDNVTAAPTFNSPTHPISDVKNELRCFTNTASSSYSISVNVNQASPGTRDVFDPFSSFPAGHTFLTLEQYNTDGSSIIRNLGFYPKFTSKPGDPLTIATFGDDSNTPYDISIKISVSSSDFITVINNLESQPLIYDLNNFNCTNSAMDALNSININLPSTKSNSALFSGNNPGDLGEDIRNLNLNNFSANNGNRKITRTVSNSNNQTAPKSSGGC